MDIIVNGARGRMGQEVCRLLQEDGHRLAAAVDRSGQDGCYARLADYTGPADVVIDFSNHEGVEELMAYCVQRGLPLVAATTGYTPEEFQRIQEGARTIPVFQSYNMSIGVALLAVWWARPQPFSAAVTWRLWRPTTTERLTPPVAPPFCWRMR